jgi:hypothetical protein
MLKRTILGIIGVFVLIQLVPVWLWQTNPPVTQEPEWDSPQTRSLAQRSCYNCHSNETNWPLYSRVAPASWLVTWDVMQARDHFNFSEWDTAGHGAEGMDEVILSGEMPLPRYLALHPESSLTEEEQAQLIEGLQASLGEGDGHTHEGDDHTHGDEGDDHHTDDAVDDHHSDDDDTHTHEGDEADDHHATATSEPTATATSRPSATPDGDDAEAPDDAPSPTVAPTATPEPEPTPVPEDDHTHDEGDGHSHDH